jgi:hypothetical protein
VDAVQGRRRVHLHQHLVAAECTDQVHWVVAKRLEGDFPGGVVMLRYGLTLDGDLIAELVIAP